jgi:hypothetical protein
MPNLKEILQREDGFVYRIDVIKYLMSMLENQVSTENAVWLVKGLESLVFAIEKEDWTLAKLVAEKLWNEKAEHQGKQNA